MYRRDELFLIVLTCDNTLAVAGHTKLMIIL